MTHTPSKDPPKRDRDKPLSIVPEAKRIDPTPRRFSLNSLRGIRREMAQVYKQARRGELDLSAACRYAYLLTTLGKLSEAELLEDRLARLETAVKEQGDD